MKRIQWLVPGAAWSIDTTEYGPEKIKITPLRDLASKYQLPTPLVQPREEGANIIERGMTADHGTTDACLPKTGSVASGVVLCEFQEWHAEPPFRSN